MMTTMWGLDEVAARQRRISKWGLMKQSGSGGAQRLWIFLAGRRATSCDVLSLLSSGSLSLFVCAYTLRTVILLCLMGSAEWNRQRGGLIPVLSCPKERLSAKAD